MYIIATSYADGQYLKCIKHLSDLPTNSLFEEFVVQNNILVSKFQISYVKEDEMLRRAVADDLLHLQSKTLALPREKEFSLLTLSCSCNVIYALLNCKHYSESSIKATKIAYVALEKALCSHLIFFPPKNDSTTENLVSMVRQFIEAKTLRPGELSLVLYSCVLICLFKVDPRYVQLIKEILEILECSGKNEICFSNDIFLLSPLEMPLQSRGATISSSIICDFSRLFLCLFHCINSSWSDALALKSGQNSSLSEIWGILKRFVNCQLASCRCSTSNNDETEDYAKIQNIYLKFARCLIGAAEFALRKQPLMALRFLNLAGAEELARTQACSIVMAYAATQFKVLGELDFQIEALKIAEESLGSPVFQPSFHSEFYGFLLAQLKLFNLPQIPILRYHLARVFLQNERYKEATVEYEKLSKTPFQENWIPFSTAFELRSPSTIIVLHEHILALLLANDCQKALDVIESSLEEDFLIFFLHAEICVQLKQNKKAIKLLSRSIAKLNQLNSTTFPVNGSKEMITSKLRFKMSELLEETGSMKDAHHQLKLSFQNGMVMDNKMQKSYQKLMSKLGMAKEISISSDPQLEMLVLKILEFTEDLTIHYLMGALKGVNFL
ncbi:putative Leucine-rich repeat-containing g-protein coupled receptor [Daphnia magna]|uniref:Putative Leucine-rich repeat-containing g-protein coupled receptor n=1 Tax=Daphnia magna TaxID=35525 RepID=A0A164PSZ7_9CRUS|nr:putative Leucine-rich repeat-containing g-protein coupled receptor [Daphnia magna]